MAVQMSRHADHPASGPKMDSWARRVAFPRPPSKPCVPGYQHTAPQLVALVTGTAGRIGPILRGLLVMAMSVQELTIAWLLVPASASGHEVVAFLHIVGTEVESTPGTLARLSLEEQRHLVRQVGMCVCQGPGGRVFSWASTPMAPCTCG